MSKITRPSTRPTFKNTLPKEVEQLAKSKTATVKKNKDGSEVRTKKTPTGGKELKTTKGKLLQSSTQYSTTQTNKHGTQTDRTYNKNADHLGRESSSWEKVTTSSKNGKDVEAVRVQSRDVFGVSKETNRTTTSSERNGTQTTAIKSNSADSRGNAQTSHDTTTVADDGRSVTTRNDRATNGTDLTTRSQTDWDGKKFSLSDGADWNRTHSFDKSYLNERDYDPSKITEKFDKAAGPFGKFWKALGIDQTWSSQVSPDAMKEHTLVQGDHGSVGTRVGITGGQSLTVNGEGVQAQFNREATAGIYAQSSGEVSGRYGTASYDASAKAEATAYVDANGTIDSNGLNAEVKLGARASVEAEVTGRVQSQSITLGGHELHAAAEGHARVSAEVAAEATGRVQITRDPPRAIASGEAGVSAVAKAEADITVSAGPFAVRASGYASAGAEARASGIIGFEDGKLKIGGSLGAALGVGLGGSVNVEIDVEQIKDITVDTAKQVADQNGDGKIGFDDIGAGIRNATRTAQQVSGAVQRTATNVARAAHRAADQNGDGKLGLDDVTAGARNVTRAATAAVSNAATAVTNTVSNAASAAKSVVSGAASRVAGWFGW